MMGSKGAKGSAEFDVFGKRRHNYKYLERAGAAHAVKQQFSRRQRRLAKAVVKTGLQSGDPA